MALDPNVSAELKALLAAAMADFKNDLLPMIDAAAKSAVSAANPVVGIVAAPVIDAVDSYVTGLLTGTAATITAPTDPASRLDAVEKHVAALTVATGHGTSALLPAVKTQTVAPAPEPEPAAAA
jgi:hypothetical protein